MFFVILAGGSGTRFWPISTPERPKQFINLTGDGSLIRLTVDRIKDLAPADHVYVLTGAKYKTQVQTELPEIPESNIILEPVGRNTAPCIAVAAMMLHHVNPDEIMVVLPADHMIKDVANFQRNIKEAEALARVSKGLITIGIKPTQPETGFGYIEADLGNPAGRGFSVKAFHEKPDLDRAKRYVSLPTFYWNAGMFIWKISSILENLNTHLPELMQTLKPLNNAIGTDDETKIFNEVFPKTAPISIDYGVMEKSDVVYVVPSAFDWSDVGSWSALESVHRADAKRNISQGHTQLVDTTNSIIINEGGPIVATIGIKDLIVVSTPNGVLVCHKDQAQDIKKLSA